MLADIAGLEREHSMRAQAVTQKLTNQQSSKTHAWIRPTSPKEMACLKKHSFKNWFIAQTQLQLQKPNKQTACAFEDKPLELEDPVASIP